MANNTNKIATFNKDAPKINANPNAIVMEKKMRNTLLFLVFLEGYCFSLQFGQIILVLIVNIFLRDSEYVHV